MGSSSAACWPQAIQLGHTALSLYLTPRVTAFVCGWFRCTEYAAAAAAATSVANNNQSNAKVVCFSLSMIGTPLRPVNWSHTH